VGERQNRVGATALQRDFECSIVDSDNRTDKAANFRAKLASISHSNS
jgi:hypothetical protein